MKKNVMKKKIGFKGKLNGELNRWIEMRERLTQCLKVQLAYKPYERIELLVKVLSLRGSDWVILPED